MLKVPCQGCEDRKLYCHATCERYISYMAENERLKAIRHQEAKLITAERDKMKIRRDRYKRRRT